MIFVDTSVWIEFFCGKKGAIESELTKLLDQDEVALAVPVYYELLMGTSKES